jgi:hypothetical protein
MFTTVTGLALMHCRVIMAIEDEPNLNSKVNGMSDVTTGAMDCTNVRS